MKINEVIAVKEVLDKLANNKSLPTRTAYRVYLILTKAQASLDFFDKRRMEIFEKYGTHNEDGSITIPNERIPEASPAMEELLNLELEDAPDKVDISLDVDLGISPAEIQVLLPFVNFVE